MVGECDTVQPNTKQYALHSAAERVSAILHQAEQDGLDAEALLLFSFVTVYGLLIDSYWSLLIPKCVPPG